MGSSMKIDPEYDGIVMLSPEIVFFNDAQPRPDGRKVYHVFEQNEGLSLPDEISEAIDNEDFELKKSELFSKASENSLQYIQQILAENGIQIQNWPNIPNGTTALVSVKSPQTLLANLSILNLNSPDPSSYDIGVANNYDDFESSCSDNGNDNLKDDPSFSVCMKPASGKIENPLDRRKSYRLNTTYHKVSAKNERKWIEMMPYSLETIKLDSQRSNNYSESTEVSHSLTPTSLNSFLAPTSEDRICDICNKLIKINCFESHVKMHLKVDNCTDQCEKDSMGSYYSPDIDLSNGSHNIEISPLKCIFCNFDGDNLETLYDHMETFHNILDYKGKIGTFNVKEGNGNDSIYNSTDLFKCDMCGFQSKYYNNLKVHIKRHNGEKPFSCPHCPYKTDRSSTLRHHLEQHLRKQTMSVKEDKLYYENFESLKQENLDFSDKFKCTLCSFATDTKNELESHVDVHSERKIYICKCCNFSCYSKFDLKVHVKSLHSTDKNNKIAPDKQSHNGQLYNCNMCDFATKYASNLQAHKRRHSGEKRYMCSYCNYRTDRSATYKNHMTQHTMNNISEDELKPETESDSGIRKVNINQEILNCPKKFICSLCSFTANTKFKLEIHAETHSEKQLVVCKFCNFLANDALDLKIHTENNHALIEGNEISAHPLSDEVHQHLSDFDYVHSSVNIEGSSAMKAPEGGIFRCSLCCFTSDAKSDLDKHGLSHMCKYCNFCCDDPMDMKIHLNNEHERRSKSSISSAEYKGEQLHMSVHRPSGEKRYACSLCYYRTAFPSNLVTHSSKSHLQKLNNPVKIKEEILPDVVLFKNESLESEILINSESFNCNFCSFSATAKPELDRHVECHYESKSISYELASQFYSVDDHFNDEPLISKDNKSDIVVPYKSDDQLFRCHNCSFIAKDLHQFEIHLLSHEERSFNCSHCEFKTLDRKHYKLHLKIHDGKQIHCCSHCEFKTTHSTGLKKHMFNIHSGEKVLFCPNCDYSSGSRRSYKNHLYVHQKKNLHTCSFCSYQTIHRAALITHIRVHTGEKPFNCDLCNYKCSQKSSLKAHKNFHHKVKLNDS